MLTRKEMKKRAKGNLKEHYVIFVVACLIGAFLGAEFANSLDAVTVYPNEPQEIEAAASDLVPEDTSANSDEAINNVPAGKEGAIDVLMAIIDGDSEKGAQLSDRLSQDAQKESSADNQLLGRRRGVLAMVVNMVTSGSIFVKLASGLNSIFASQDVVAVILIILSLLFSLGIWFFVENLYTVISRRIFLEGRIYKNITMQRFLFLLRLRKWTKAAWVMFVSFVFKFLWSFTVVGGIIKYFSYYLVPFIVAENPDIGALQAINLSRRMMKGHKWECFVFNLSFMGWTILNYVTFGIVGILFTNPYQRAAFGEYYVELRRLAFENQIPGVELLDDKYLFEAADAQLLKDTYSDVVAVLADPVEEPEKRKGIKAFLANYLGIVFLSSPKERKVEEWEAKMLRIHVLRNSLEGKSYPGRLSPIPEHSKRQRIETVNYLRHYTVWSLILLFISFSFIGWVWEVSLHLISDGIFVNRGVLHGPWLPIYGGGGVLILTLLYRFRKNPAAEFLCTVAVCGCVEYFTSWYLEIAHDGQKWWDYSGYFLNLNGRICAEGLLVFGVGGMAIVYMVAPLLDNHIRKIQYKILVPLCIALMCIFLTDQMYSSKHPNTGHGITDYETSSLKEISLPGNQLAYYR